MSLSAQTKRALGKAVEKAGNKLKLSKTTGVSQPSINTFLSGKRDVANMTVHTLERLFPEMRVYFFRDEQPQAPPVPSGFSALEIRAVKTLREMDEEGRLEAIDALARLAERHPKNNQNAKIA